MMRCPWLVALVVSATLAPPATAGILFGRQAKPNPAERVPQLLATLKTDQDERKREAAAEELREFDPGAHPVIVPGLISALQQDAKAGVRLEAAQSLARLRPISQQAGWALEEAAARDASLRVRLQARTLLLQYRISGYRSKGTSEEPPLAPPATHGVRAPALPPVPQTSSGRALSGQRQGTTFVPMETPPPPLATPLLESPKVRPVPPLVPSQTPKLQAPPASGNESGPELTLPQ